MYLYDVRDQFVSGLSLTFQEIQEDSMQRSLATRRAVLACVATAVCSFQAPIYAQAADGPTAPIEQLNNGLLKIMQAGGKTPFAQRYQMLEPVIEQTFDLQTILQESIGPTWPNLSADQQSMVMQAFRRYTISSYVNSFDNYNGQRFEVSPDTRPVANGEQIVQTRIVPRAGTGHELDYVMRQGSGGWRVVDVLADGSISRVAVQRSDFRRLLARGGPSALAESLKTKSADLSEGTG